MRRLTAVLAVAVFLSMATVSTAANFYWRTTKTDLDAITGLASGDRGLVITASGEVRHYYYTSSWQATTPMTAQMTLVDPDGVYAIAATIPMLAVESSWAPHGITITKVGWKVNAAASPTVVFKEYSSPTVAVSTIESLSGSSVTEASSTSIDDASVAADSIVMVTIDSTSLNWTQVYIEFYITPSS